jgi:hypothetical protein
MTAIVVKKWDAVLASLGTVVILSLVLYKYWYKNLSTEHAGEKTANTSR